MIEIIFFILLNGLPLIILIIPLFFIWKKYIGKIYFRIVLGLIVFYIIYWVLPIIFQVGQEPDNLKIGGKSDYGKLRGIISGIVLFTSRDVLPELLFLTQISRC